VAEAELMPRLLGGDTEMVCGKLKEGNRFLKPNFEALPSFTTHAAVSNLFNLGRQKAGAQYYRDLRMSALEQWGRAIAWNFSLDSFDLYKLICRYPLARYPGSVSS
jgi:hypothetical protein